MDSALAAKVRRPSFLEGTELKPLKAAQEPLAGGNMSMEDQPAPDTGASGQGQMEFRIQRSQPMAMEEIEPEAAGIEEAAPEAAQASVNEPQKRQPSKTRNPLQ